MAGTYNKQAPVLDPLCSVYADDPIIASLLVPFSRHLKEKLFQLLVHLNEGAWHNARRLCHELQGASAQYGFPLLSTQINALSATITEEPRDEDAVVAAFELCTRIFARIVKGLEPHLPDQHNF